MIKYIIFDLDGVLVDAREMHYKALNGALEKFGYTITRDEHLAIYDGLPTRKKLTMLTERKGMPEELYDEVWQEKQHQTREIIDKEFTYDERMRGILHRLREEGYRLAVCSNSIRESTKMMLLRCGLLEYFDFYLSNQDVQHVKPHPEMYLQAFIVLGASPKECMVVEDSHHGRQAAFESGAHVCGVENVQDVTYEKIKARIDKVNGRESAMISVPKWQGSNLRIVIPMAGEGKSYQRAGFTFPKPLVDIRGKPMIQWVVENINAEGTFIFIVLREQYEKYNLKYLLNLIAPHCKVVLLDEPTKGAALSVMAAKDLFNDDDPLVVVNSDQVIDWNSNEFFYAMAADGCDGGMVTFESTHPKWSYARTGKDGLVVETAEKKPISNIATAGVYYFAKGAEFVRYATQMIEAGITTNGEYFVCPVYNECIRDGKKVRVFPIERMWSFSTPEDLEAFLKHNETNKVPVAATVRAAASVKRGYD